MRIAHILMALALSVLITGLVMGSATANVPGVAINAPPPPPAPNVATAGSDALIKVTVTHRDTGSPALHYVDRVGLYDGDKLLKEWTYDQNSYKKDEVWTETYSAPVKSDMHLRAVAHCTVHGYEFTGVHVRVLPAGTKPSDMMKTDASSAGMQAFGYPSASKASDFMSSADSKFMGNVIKAQTNNIKSFQGKLSAWMKSSDGQQFITQKDQQMAQGQASVRSQPMTAQGQQAAGEMGRASAMAAKPTASMKPSATVRRSLDVYAGAPVNSGTSGMPRVSVISTPTPITGSGLKGPRATMKASPTVKHMQARLLATRMASPTAKVKASPTMKATASPTVKHMLAMKKPSPTPKASPTMRPSPAPTVKTPAQSYGIFGLGGPVPSPRTPTATVRAVPSGSPTPVPGSFTPRYPGEAGAGKGSPTPTVAPKISPTAKVATPMPSASGTAGMAGTPVTSDSRYTARGPGITNDVMSQPPASAPGSLASPSIKPVRR